MRITVTRDRSVEEPVTLNLTKKDVHELAGAMKLALSQTVMTASQRTAAQELLHVLNRAELVIR